MQKPSRRIAPQFRLRTLLILLAVIAVPLAWIASERRQSRREMQIAAELREQGIRDIEIGGPYDWNTEGKPRSWRRDIGRSVLGRRVLSVSSNGEELRLENLASIGELSCVRSIWLTHAPIDDLAPLANLKSLQYLYLYNSPVSDLAPLAGLKNLQSLTICGARATDLAPLASLFQLQSLDLRMSQTTKKQIEALGRALPSCKIIHDHFP